LLDGRKNGQQRPDDADNDGDRFFTGFLLNAGKADAC